MNVIYRIQIALNASYKSLQKLSKQLSPFVKVEFRCTQNQNKQNVAKPKKYDREPF